VRDALRAAGVTVHVVDPARVRYLAKAQGQRAKTDAIDAAVICCLEAVMNLGRLPILRVCHYLASLTRVT